MKREISRVALGALLAAAWSRSSLAAANVIFDVRAESTYGKFVQVRNVGDQITIDVVALVAGANNNTSDDGFQQVIASFATNNATASASNLKGNLTNLAINPTFAATNPAPVGDFDSDGDIEIGKPIALGGNTTTSNYAWFLSSSGSPTFASTGTEVINGTTYSHFDLGKFTFTAGGGYTDPSLGTATGPASLAPNQSTTLQIALMPGASAVKPVRVAFDSVSLFLFATDTRVSVGQPVTISTLNDASISLTSSPAWPVAGKVSLIGSNGVYTQTSPPVQPNYDVASIAINDIGNESGNFIAAIQLGGNGTMSLSDVAAALQAASPGWSFIVNPGSIPGIADPQSGIWSLEAISSNPLTAGANDYFNLDVSSTGYTITVISAVPEPASMGLVIGAASFMTLRPNRTRKRSRTTSP